MPSATPPEHTRALSPGWLPADLAFATGIELDDPGLLASAPELGVSALQLYRLDSERDVAVVRSTTRSGVGGLVPVDPSAPSEGQYVLGPSEPSGPNGLTGQTWRGFGDDFFYVLFRGPALNPQERAAVVRILGEGDGSLIAEQNPVQVPGIGSVPIAIGSFGTVASYTHRDENGDQRAVALGVVRLCEWLDPLAVFRWWHGDGDEPVYHDPPPSWPGRASLWLSYASPAQVGDHHVVVIDVDGSGLLAVIGTYALTHEEVVEIVTHLDIASASGTEPHPII